jgi:hypothetical protein
MRYDNTGSAQHDDVKARIFLPDGLDYVAESATLATRAANRDDGEWELTAVKGDPTTTAVSIGPQPPGSTVWVMLDLVVSDSAGNIACGDNVLFARTEVSVLAVADRSDAPYLIVDKPC